MMSLTERTAAAQLGTANNSPSSGEVVSYFDVLHIIYGEMKKIHRSKQQLVVAACGFFFFILFVVAGIQSTIQSNFLFCCAGGIGTVSGVSHF
jgi:hypothetical protein